MKNPICVDCGDEFSGRNYGTDIMPLCKGCKQEEARYGDREIFNFKPQNSTEESESIDGRENSKSDSESSS